MKSWINGSLLVSNFRWVHNQFPKIICFFKFLKKIQINLTYLKSSLKELDSLKFIHPKLWNGTCVPNRVLHMKFLTKTKVTESLTSYTNMQVCFFSDIYQINYIFLLTQMGCSYLMPGLTKQNGAWTPRIIILEYIL